MSAQIFKFPPPNVEGIVSRPRAGKPDLPPPATETAKNSRIRVARRDAWWHAAHVADYWLARADWSDALRFAQDHGIGDAASFSAEDRSNRIALIAIWREAIAKMLVTPAPDLRAITWKRTKLKSRTFRFLPVKKERVEQAIADDVAFLAAHPTRRKRVVS